MRDEFEIVELRETHIRVRHLAQGHEYTFGRAWTDDGVRVLSAAMAHVNDRADFGHEGFQASARAFANERAREAGMID